MYGIEASAYPYQSLAYSTVEVEEAPDQRLKRKGDLRA
jgi:hypothetical protein